MEEKTSKILFWAVTGLISAAVILFAVGWTFGLDNYLTADYTACKYGQKCYQRGQEHGNCKYIKYFQTIEQCKEYIK